MLKFFRRNNKKLLAISGVFLMISFVATTRYNPGGGDRGSTAIGRIGKETVLASDVDRARQDWRMVNQAIMVEYPDGSGQTKWEPLLAIRQFSFLAPLSTDPLLTTLLQKEAEQMGVVIGEQQVQDFVSHGVAIRLPDGRIVPFDQIPDPDYAQSVREAAASLLRILDGMNRAERITKISSPLKDYALSQEHQSLQVRYVSIGADKLLDKVPAPTTQQLQEQFEKFADVEPTGATSEQNPFGFGYKIPDQVRLQTISIPHSEVTAAVKKSKSDYDWEVAARMYYRSHKADFPTTKPAALPPDAMMIAAPTTLASATTKPFEEVRSVIMDSVIAPDVQALAENVQKSILSTLSGDWAAYHGVHPETQPSRPSDAASSPAISSPAISSPAMSSLGVPYDSYDYLKALSAKVQKDFNVLPATASYNQPLSLTELGKLPGIGSARTTSGSLDFEAAAVGPTLSLFEPAAPLQDDTDNTYIFRLTDRIPAHRPASVSEVTAAVTADWKKVQAYELAKSQAQQLLEAARKSSLEPAATASGATVTTTAFFGGGTEAAPDAVPVAVKAQAEKLLSPAAKHEPAVLLVEAPAQSKVFVSELAGVRPDWPEGQRLSAEAQVTGELRNEFAQPLKYLWFSLPAVEARLGFIDLEKNKSAG